MSMTFDGSFPVADPALPLSEDAKSTIFKPCKKPGFSGKCAPGGSPGSFTAFVQMYNYLPQRSCCKVMFLHVSVILSTGGLGWQADIPLASRHTPPLAGRHPPGQTHLPGQTPPPGDGNCSGWYASY